MSSFPAGETSIWHVGRLKEDISTINPAVDMVMDGRNSMAEHVVRDAQRAFRYARHTKVPDMHERRFKKPLRYLGHDYRAPCTVHVTICTHARQLLFGSVTADGIHLYQPGRFVEHVLIDLQSDASGLAIDTHIVMPDHVHAIIVLGINPLIQTPDSIPDVVRRFKMRVMRSWPKGVKDNGWPRYEAHLWQPSYYDTLIRNDAHLEQTRQYILANPARWIERMK